MKNITITKKNLQKAYDEGCDDTKKVLKSLCPDEFEDKIKYDRSKIYGVKGSCGSIYKLHRIADDDRCAWLTLETSFQYANGIYDTPEKALKSWEGTYKIESFDNQKDFFEWALKAIK